jgi:hypothetical protein
MQEKYDHVSSFPDFFGGEAVSEKFLSADVLLS